MQNKLNKKIYKEFIHCNPKDHLFKPNNSLTRPDKIYIQSDITGRKYPEQINLNNTGNNNVNIVSVTPEIENQRVEKPKETKKQDKIIYDENTFNQIELRGFITKQLLEQSLLKESNLFHIAEDIFDGLCDRYHQFKEILHTLKTEFDNSVECIIETGKELTKKINHVIYELYVAVMHKV